MLVKNKHFANWIIFCFRLSGGKAAKAGFAAAGGAKAAAGGKAGAAAGFKKGGAAGAKFTGVTGAGGGQGFLG